MRPE
jgi:iron transport multicopper oxidase